MVETLFHFDNHNFPNPWHLFTWYTWNLSTTLTRYPIHPWSISLHAATTHAHAHTLRIRTIQWRTCNIIRRNRYSVWNKFWMIMTPVGLTMIFIPYRIRQKGLRPRDQRQWMMAWEKCQRLWGSTDTQPSPFWDYVDRQVKEKKGNRGCIWIEEI